MNSVICIQSIYNEIMLRFKLLNEILYNAQNFYIARVNSTYPWLLSMLSLVT